jgi:hypothetical protein
LIRVAKVLPDQTPKFLESVQASIDAYIKASFIPEPGEVQKEIVRLYRTVTEALEDEGVRTGDVISLLESLSARATEVLQSRASDRQIARPHDTGWPDYSHVPSAADLSSANRERRIEALRILGSFCITEAHIVEGRNRPLGKRSRPTTEVSYYGPRVRRGHRNDVEQLLCANLAIDYIEATERTAGRSGRRETRFVKLVDAVLKSVGAGHINAGRLVRDHTEARSCAAERERRSMSNQTGSRSGGLEDCWEEDSFQPAIEPNRPRGRRRWFARRWSSDFCPGRRSARGIRRWRRP